MDTITHGIAGALLGKAVFRGENMFSPPGMTRGKIITWSLMIGAIFPDCDMFRDMFSRNPLLVMTWHRSVTHSLVLLPVYAVLLAALTRWFARRRNWDGPSFALLTGIYAVGILSHILLDLATSFGTMIWSPVKWSRPAWDLLFIIDFAFSAILLVPQILATTYSEKETVRQRALGNLVLSCLVALLVAGVTRYVGVPISNLAVIVSIFILALAFLLPLLRGWGLRVSRAGWNQAGLVAAILYMGLTVYAHHVALDRVKQMVPVWGTDVQSIAALPFAPSLWHWDGLALTPRGVYEVRLDLSEKGTETDTPLGSADQSGSLSYRFYPDAIPNTYIEKARSLPEVQTVLWFDRFPVIRFHKENDVAVVEIVDVRFPQIRPGRPTSFTYRVRMASDGAVLSKGWEKP